MAYDKNYYANKKQELIQKNQKKTQRFLSDTMDFVEEIKGIDQQFQEINKLELEQVALEKAKKPISKEVINEEKELDKLHNKK